MPSATASRRRRRAICPPGNPSWSAKLPQGVRRRRSQVDKPILFSVAITIAAFIPLFTIAGQSSARSSARWRAPIAYALLAHSPDRDLHRDPGGVVAADADTHQSAEKETFAVRQLAPPLRLPCSAARSTSAPSPLLIAARRGVPGGARRRTPGHRVPAQARGRQPAGSARRCRRRSRSTAAPPIVKPRPPGAEGISRDRHRGVASTAATDDAPIRPASSMPEFFAPPQAARAMAPRPDKEKLVADMQARFAQEFVGIEFQLLAVHPGQHPGGGSGVKGENSIKLFGKNLETLEETAKKIHVTSWRRCRASEISASSASSASPTW